MPKDMFYKISVEKQAVFIKAATKEFTTKSFELVSVNSIIKEANISRGSFYNYFKDLDSLFEFLFETVRQKRFERAKTLIVESNKDFFVFVEKLFYSDYEEYTQEGTYSLFRNYIHYIRNTKNKTIKEGIIIPLGKILDKPFEFSSLFDISWISIPLPEFLDVIEMTIVIVIDLFITSEQLGYSKEETMEIFRKRIQVIKRGIS